MRGLGIASTFLLVFSGCHLAQHSHERIESQQIETTPLYSVDLTTFNGAIDVVPSSDQTIEMEIKYRGYGASPEQAEANSEALSCSVEAEDGCLKIQATKPADQWLGSVEFSLKVPQECSLTLKTSNGKITCQGFPNGVEARSSNGTVHLINIGNEIKAKTSNGTIRVENAIGHVDLETSNGRVFFSGQPSGSENQIRTSNGRVELQFPDDYLVELATRTSNGSIECSMPTQTILKEDKRSLQVIIGEGDVNHVEHKLNVRTSNGSIKILPMPKASENTSSDVAEVDSELSI
ncbi:MAG: DUF4097 family beta strand repeat-containing protein [bacterium]|nr:DUF4097 family beta strand repeat-containing protein [bacterium]